MSLIYRQNINKKHRNLVASWVVMIQVKKGISNKIFEARSTAQSGQNTPRDTLGLGIAPQTSQALDSIFQSFFPAATSLTPLEGGVPFSRERVSRRLLSCLHRKGFRRELRRRLRTLSCLELLRSLRFLGTKSKRRTFLCLVPSTSFEVMPPLSPVSSLSSDDGVDDAIVAHGDSDFDPKSRGRENFDRDSRDKCVSTISRRDYLALQGYFVHRGKDVLPVVISTLSKREKYPSRLLVDLPSNLCPVLRTAYSVESIRQKVLADLRALAGVKPGNSRVVSELIESLVTPHGPAQSTPVPPPEVVYVRPQPTLVETVSNVHKVVSNVPASVLSGIARVGAENVDLLPNALPKVVAAAEFIRVLSLNYSCVPHFDDICSFVFEMIRFALVPDITNRTFCLVSLLRLKCFSAVYKEASKAIEALTCIVKGVVVPHAGDTALLSEESFELFDEVFRLRSLAGDAFNSEISGKFCYLVSLFFSTMMFKSLPDGMKFALTTLRGEVNNGLSETSYVGLVLDFFLSLLKNFLAFAKSGDPMDLLGRSKMVVWDNSAAAEIQAWNDFRSKVKRPYDLEKSMVTVKRLIKEGNEMTNTGKARSLLSTIQILIGISSSMEASMCRPKAMPFGLMITGAPGCGKSRMSENLSAIVRRTANLSEGLDISYQWNLTLKHQEPRNPVLVLIFNDFGCAKEESLEVNVLDLLQQCVESSAILAPRASIADKNQCEMFPHLTIVNGNQNVYQLHKSSGGADKLNRRYKALEMVYTDKARARAAELGIDVTALMKDKPVEEPGFVKYTYGNICCEKTTIDMRVVNNQNTRTFDTAEEFLIFFSCEYREHVRREAHVVESRSDRVSCPLGIYLPHSVGSTCPCLSLPNPKPHGLDEVVGKCVRGVDEIGVQIRHAAYSAEGNLATGEPVTLREALAFSVVDLSKNLPEFVREFTKMYVTLAGQTVLRLLCLYFGITLWAPLLLKGFRVLVDPACLVRDEAGYRPTTIKELLLEWFCLLVVFFVSPLGPVEVLAFYCSARVRATTLAVLDGAYEHYAVFAERTWYNYHALRFFNRCRPETSWGTMTYVAVSLGTLALLASAVRAISVGWRNIEVPHGSIHGSPVEGTIPPEAPKPVLEVRGKAQAWFGSYRSPETVNSYNCLVYRGTVKMRAVILNANTVLVPGHLLFKTYVSVDVAPIKTGEILKFTHAGVDFFYTYTPTTCKLVKADCCLLAVPSIRTMAGTALVVRESTVVPSLSFVGVNKVLSSSATHPQYGMKYAGNVNVAGDCGMIVTDEDGALYGLYGGDAAGTGCVVTFCRAEIEAAMRAVQRFTEPHGYSDNVPITKKQAAQLMAGLHPRSDTRWYCDANGDQPLVVLGHICRESSPKMTGKPTVLQDFFRGKCQLYAPPRTGKAQRCEDGEWRSIVTHKMRGLRLSGTYNHDIMKEAVELALADVTYDGPPLGYITLEVAIAGSELNMYVNGRDTSKAVGEILRSEGVTAQNAVVQEGDSWRLHPTVLRCILDFEDRLSKGVTRTRSKTVIKDENLPINKVENGKGRFFFVCGYEENVVLRKRALNVLSHILANPGMHDCYAGMNAGSSEWKMLYERLTDGGRRTMVLETDQNGYDSHHDVMIGPYVAYMVGVAQKLGYSAEERTGLERVLLSMFYNLTEWEGNLFMMSYGVTSGRSDTIQVNSIVHKLIYYYAFCKHYVELGQIVPKDVRNKLRLALVGDDSLASVSEDCDWFDGTYLAKVCLELGYELTSARKELSLQDRVSIYDATFMKRRFRVEGQRVFAPIVEESIYKSLSYYTKTQVTEAERNLATLLGAQREFFLHGEGRFGEFQRELDQLQTERGIVVRRYTFQELLDQFDASSFETWA